MGYFPKVQISKATPVEEVIRLGAQCSKCGSCCSRSSGFIAPEEIPKIARYFQVQPDRLIKDYMDTIDLFHTSMFRPKLVKQGKKPYGKCVFLGASNGCMLQTVKPLHCKVGNCSELGEQMNQWYFLNYCVNANDPQSIRDWATFLKNNQTIPGGTLFELVPNEDKLNKILSYEILR